MPILTLQQSMRRLGRIRMGSKATTTNKQGKEVEFPKKLETWRMTSVSKETLEAAAAIYGGEVTEWAGSPNGRQWELFTDADSLDVIIPPGDMAFSQWFELWSGGGCQRRCDGQTEQRSDSPCMCPADPEERIAAAGKGKACKPTTRLFVIQPHLPDIGLWHFESHGFYAATEIPGTINIIRSAAANGTLIPARLRIEQRTSKTGTETLRYAVPVIELPTLTTHTLMTGEIAGGVPGRATVGELGRGVPDQGAAGETPIEPSVSAEQRVMSRVNSELRAAAAQTPIIAQLDIVKERAERPADAPLRPLPPAGTGDGSAMRRAILTKAKRLEMDADGLDAVCRGRIGKNFADITSPDDANEVLAALDGKPIGATV